MRVIVAVLMMLITAGAQAGSQAPSKSVFQPEQIIDFAKQVERYAAAHQVLEHAMNLFLRYGL